MTLVLDDGDVRLYHGDALTVLQTLEAESVHMCVTSPPFYGLRDYGTGRWEGGDPDCDHRSPTMREGRNEERAKLAGSESTNAAQLRLAHRSPCGKCGAVKVDQQIGLEETPEQWVQSLVAVFREVRRVLRDDGTLWLEIGDSYAANRTYQVSDNKHKAHEFGDSNALRVPPGYKPKDLIGAPWQLAFALRADGWYLRSDIVWARPNPMPESVTDRPTKSHSYVFLLAKQPRYFFDQEAVRERADASTAQRWANGGEFRPGYKDQARDGKPSRPFDPQNANPAGRNVRSVWNISTQPYPEAHFATFPEELARRCILAGTSEQGCCPECGAPWIRQTEQDDPPENYTPGHTPEFGVRRFASATGGYTRPTSTTGWRLACVHDGHQPCVVLDPFVGSGTVPYVARKHGRHAIGIDLSSSYLELAARRLQQLSLFA